TWALFGSVRQLDEHEPRRTSPQMFGSVRYGEPTLPTWPSQGENLLIFPLPALLHTIPSCLQRFSSPLTLWAFQRGFQAAVMWLTWLLTPQTHSHCISNDRR